MSTVGFLELPPTTSEAQALFDEDIAEDGHVMNVTKLWSHNAPAVTGLFDLMGQALVDENLSFRQRGILVAACASTLGDSYCSLAWVPSWREPPIPNGRRGSSVEATRA